MNSAGKIFYFIILLLTLRASAGAQDIEKQFNYAMHLYEMEDYFNAVTEFKRLLFFDSDNVYKYEANFYAGSSYKAGARFNDAIRYFGYAASAGDSDETYAAKMEIVKSNILRRTFKQAHGQLNDLEIEASPDNINELLYWRGWIYMFSDEWDKAAEIFGRIDKDHQLKYLALKTDESKYSVQKAKILSIIIPGAGQFYTGHYVSGALSLGWNILWGYLTINAFVEERIFDGFAVGNLLWLRFYRGNIQNAEKFAIMENKKISSGALEFLENSYTGAKP